MNILTIDLEEWFMDMDSSNWHSYESRIFEPTKNLLGILDKKKYRATFFIVGYLAEKYPDFIQTIYDMGHDIGTHGYLHTNLSKLSPDQFEADLRKSQTVLKKITGEDIILHRSCQFSLSQKTSWAIDILEKNGIKIDSSIFPVKTPIYGVPDAPMHPYYIRSDDITRMNNQGNLLEVPLSVYEPPLFNTHIPIAGGFYFRLFPYSFIHHAIKKLNKQNHPAILYFHPWEFDTNPPVIRGRPWYNYFGLKYVEKRFRCLLRDFQFTSLSNFHWGSE
jgi:polysaccharide deacetylase family protein (PEP-CTERM system associated)